MEAVATFLFNVFVYAFGFYVVKRNGGIKNNLPFGFSIVLFTLYYFITPFYFYLTGRKTIWGDEGTSRGVGEDITDYYLIGLNYYALANLLFILGYLCLSRKESIKNALLDVKAKISDQRIKKGIVFAFAICYSLVLFNYLNEGFNPFLVIFGDRNNEIAGITATSNYLKNFSDSIIAIIIIAYFYKVNKWIRYPITFLAFALFALMGFRYRIILTILGMIFASLYTSKKRFQMSFGKVALVAGFFYIMFFITYNRFVFTTGNWEKLVVNPVNYEYSLFFEQTRGMLDDITIIKYYKTDPNPTYDHGITFLYFFIRVIPRSIVGDEWKDSFYPFPAYTIMQEAYDVKKHWGPHNTGEAPLHLAYFYIAGGLPALLMGCFLVGLIIRWVQNKFYPFSDRNKIILILLSAGLFQWVTRGYFPGFVDHFAFMLLGFWMTMLLAKFLPVSIR